MLSPTGEYALRAVTYLAKHQPDWPIPGRQIAEEADIPPRTFRKSWAIWCVRASWRRPAGEALPEPLSGRLGAILGDVNGAASRTPAISSPSRRYCSELARRPRFWPE